MFIPSKHENLKKSTILLGAEIIKSLKTKEYNVDDLFQELKQAFDKNMSLNQYYNTLTFLWLADVIELNEFNLKLRK